MIHEPLVSVLRSGRDVFNAKFADARRRYPALDAATFKDFLAKTVDPLAQVCPLPGESLTAFVVAAYDVGLQLTGENLLGSPVRVQLMTTAWRKLVPASWPLVARSPAGLLGALSNAVHALGAARGTRVEEWIDRLATLAPNCPDVTAWLQVGQLLAWRAGLAHYRTGALELAGSLPETLARAALGAPSGADWSATLTRLRDDPWFDPAAPDDRAGAAPRVAAKVGAFRGLGGNFSVPPLVAAADGQLLVRSGYECWLLIADAFGHSFHHATVEEFVRAQRRAPVNPEVRWSGGTFTVRGRECPHPLPGPASSGAVLPHTLALTSALSYAVVLVAY